MDLTAYIKEMREAIAAYTERHGEEPNVLYMTARLMARIEAWVLRSGFVKGSYCYLSGFGMMPSGHVEWFQRLTVKLLDGEGLRWAVAREHVVDGTFASAAGGRESEQKGVAAVAEHEGASATDV